MASSTKQNKTKTKNAKKRRVLYRRIVTGSYDSVVNVDAAKGYQANVHGTIIV